MRKLIIVALFLLQTNNVLSQTNVIIPDTINTSIIELELQNGSYQFYDGINTSTMGANGGILGPTLILNQNTDVKISVENQLSDTTTIHWHGLHVSAENDGGPHTTIAPNTTWNPQFTVLDKAGTYWYHPHLHKKTNEHVTMGIAGFIIVRDSEEAMLDLPRTYGIDDFPLVFQTKNFDSNKQIVFPSNTDSVVMVNATVNGELDVPAQVIRLRLLNGSSQRVFNIGFKDSREFYQIGSDGGLLSEPISMNRLKLSPGERAEVLVDFSNYNGETINLYSFASELPNGTYGATYPGTGFGMTLDGYNPNPLNGRDFKIMQFNVVESTDNSLHSIPPSLVNVSPLNEADSDITRFLTLNPEIGGMGQQMGPNVLNGTFVINNQTFDMDLINYNIPLNNTEIWSITNMSPIGHPFHIHDVQFYILDRNGNLPPLNERGRKDVVFINPMETIRFITRFEDFANDPVPYMYHCHMLTHEDDGMMGQFIVTDPSVGIEDEENINLVKSFLLKSVYPNPFNPTTNIEYQINEPSEINLSIYNMRGDLVIELLNSYHNSGNYNAVWNGRNFKGQIVPSGTYVVRLSSNENSDNIKIMFAK